MSEQASSDDSGSLRGARLLFVDDRAPALEMFIEALRMSAEPQVEIVLLETLADAVAEIANADRPFDVVVIDLFMPGEFPAELAAFSDRLPDVVMNQGQALGLWLTATRPDVPYIYLSAVPETYRPIDADRPAQPEPVNKFTESPFDFPSRLAEILRQKQSHNTTP